MEARQYGNSVRLRSENPLESSALMDARDYLPRVPGLLPDDCRGIDLHPEECHDVIASLAGSRMPEWIQREIATALNPWIV